MHVVAVQGVRNVPTRLRIQISRRRNDDEDAKVPSTAHHQHMRRLSTFEAKMLESFQFMKLHVVGR
jgi:Ribosomal protein L31e